MAKYARLTITVAFLCGISVVLASGTPPASAAIPIVRLIHSVPDIPAIDVYVDGKEIVTGLEFTNAKMYDRANPRCRHSLPV